MYITGYPEIDSKDFDAAYKDARDLDEDIPEEPTIPSLKQAVKTLARRIALLEKEWC
jgi:hypothetical protein